MRRRYLISSLLIVPSGGIHTFPPNGYMKTWREHVVKLLVERCGAQVASESAQVARDVVRCKQSDIYEFGVFTGRALRGLALRFNRSRVSVGNIWGFDSFEGLPKEHANGTQMRWA